MIESETLVVLGFLALIYARQHEGFWRGTFNGCGSLCFLVYWWIIIAGLMQN